MTQREFLNTVISANLSDEVTAKATAMLINLDNTNAKRASKPSKRAIENQPLKEAILAYLGEHSDMTAENIGLAIGVGTPKASALCVQMAKEGALTSTEVKIPKKGKVKAYRLA